MKPTIDLNADLGEGGAQDAALMQVVTSCNIACGGHAGDAASMRSALELARQNGVAAGAHPSFPDRENFGRVQFSLSGVQLEAELGRQIEALKQVASELGISLTHLKPHGALYNMAARDAALAVSIAQVAQSLLPGSALIGPAHSQLQRRAEHLGLSFRAEGFADRAYEPDGQLRDRTRPGAVIEEEAAQVRQALSMALEGSVTAFSGERIDQLVDTICVHGDTQGAFAAACAIRAELEQNGITVCAP